jgi:phage/plasmid-like protein (TIGR03299 family)
MAHELTFRNGIAEMFSVRETPWHREGRVLTDAPTLAQALALAGQDFEVECEPYYIRRTTDDGDEYFIPSTYGRAVMRTDTDQELGSVGQIYTPLQNAEAFRVLEPLLDNGLVTLETGGSLREGADVWLQVRFNVERLGATAQQVFGNAGVIPYGLVANNHNGRCGARVQITPTRAVCANTLGMTEREARNGGRAIVVRHTPNVAREIIKAAKTVFKGVVDRSEEAARAYQALQRVALTEAEFRRMVLDVIAPDARQRQDASARAIASADARRDEVQRLWTEGDGHLGDRSAWEAYNGAVQAIDHDECLFPGKSAGTRTASLMRGRLAEKKLLVLDGLTRHARKVGALTTV